MFHMIKFRMQYQADLEVSRQQRLEQILIRPGTRWKVQVRPYVVEGSDGPAEVADLFFEDGTTIRSVPFACFTFMD